MANVKEEEEFVFKGKQLECKKELFAQGYFTYAGYFNEKDNQQGIGGRTTERKKAVIRRIRQTDCLGGWESSVSKFMKSSVKESNVKYFDLTIVLQIFAYEDDKDGWRYFALEPYISTLYHYCNDLYKGPPLPSEPQVIDQMISGIDYLHKEKYPHGDLNPLNVIISRDGRIKLSDFGLSKFSYTTKFDRPDDLSIQSGIPEICRRKYWLQCTLGQDNERNYELVNDDDENIFPKGKQDIFAVGCLIVYFLTKGVHPFGDDIQAIRKNMKSKNPINLKKLNEEHSKLYKRALDNMIKQSTANKSKWWREAIEQFGDALLLKVYKNKLLGQGSFGKVYEGKYKGVPVAVKEIEINYDETSKSLTKREILEHTKLDHETVLRLLTYDDKYSYLVLELCAGTLTDYCEKKYNGPELPPDGLVLYQIANGLHYIHSRNLVHRDVKPENILISMTTPVQMKLSDFGFVKKTSPQGTFTQHSGLKGTLNWMAPEVLALLNDDSRDITTEEIPHGTIQTDTFAAGCVFFNFLTRGKHPFGNSVEIPGNILSNNPIKLIEHNQNLQGEDRALYELIGKMIKPLNVEVREENRISLPDVIEELTTKLYPSRQFKRVIRLVGKEGGYCVARFHPKKPVIACGMKEIIFFSAENWSIPFSNWKEDENKFQIGQLEQITTLEWNADGTQLAAASYEDVIVCWSYPSGKILFQKKLDQRMNRIEWNPFRPNVFATFYASDVGSGKVVSFFNSCPDDQRPFHFCTIEREERIESVQWISENRVALGLWGGWPLLDDRGIQIWEIDESTTSAKFVKRFHHEGVTESIVDMAWDERTKCLVACSSYGWIAIWSMDSDKPIHATQVDGGCRRLARRPNGKQTDDERVDAARKSADNFILAAGGLNKGRIVVWTPREAEKTRILSQHSHLEIDWLSFSPDGRFLASADVGGKVYIWSAENWEPVYIGNREPFGGSLVRHFSWLSSSTDVPDYKLTFNSYDDKVTVIEYAVGHIEEPSKD